MDLPTVIVGTIGYDSHNAASFILSHTLRKAGFQVVYLGSFVPQEEFLNAAIETRARAILVSSLYGMAAVDCDGFRAKCIEAGLKDILLYIGGILGTTGQDFEAVEKKFKELGFDRVYPPSTSPAVAVTDLYHDLGLE